MKALGENPLCVVRSADKAKEVLGADANIAVADVDDRAGLQKALKGVERVFIVTGHNPKSDAQQINIIEAAKAAGVKYILKVSGGRAVVGPDVRVGGRPRPPHGRGASEEERDAMVHPQPRPVHAERDGAGGLDQDRRQDDPAVPEGPEDVVRRRARHRGGRRRASCKEPCKHHGKIHDFTGEQTSYGEFAKVIADVLGKPVTYVGRLAGGGRSRDEVAQHAGLAGRAHDRDRKVGAKGGFTEEKTGPVREIVGRAPISTRQFAQDHKRALS